MAVSDIRYGFYNSVNHDRIYNAEDISGLFDGVLGDGITQYGDKLAVSPYTNGGAWAIQVGIGRGWFNNTWILNPQPLYITLTTPLSGYYRLDYVVVEINKDSRVNTIKVLEGSPTPTDSREAPEIASGEGGVFQYILCSLYFRPTSASVLDAEMVDFRGSSETGAAKFLSWMALFGESAGSFLGIESGGTGANTVPGIRRNLGIGTGDGSLPIQVSQGGTGSTNARVARENLGIGSYNDGAGLPILNGGTGATNVNDARKNLGLGQANGALPLTIAQGGTGATTVEGAIANIFSSSTGTVNMTARVAEQLRWGTKIMVNLANTGSKTITGVNGNQDGAQDLTNSGDGGIGVYGTLPISKGGTGKTTAAEARNALGLGNTTGALPIANGGTGATTAAAARNALGLGNTTGALPIANGGTGATDRLNAFKNITNQSVASPTYAVTLTNNWGSAGYSTVQQLRKAMGLGDTTGVLPISNGGTGQSTWYGAHAALGVQATSIWQGNLHNDNASITADVRNYDFAVYACRPQGQSSDSGIQFYTIPVPYLSSARYVVFANDDAGSYLKFYVSNTTVKLVGRGSLGSGDLIAVYGMNKKS